MMPTIFPNRAFMKFARIAIWNKNRVAVAMSIGVWGLNAAFSILGGSFSSLFYGDREPTLAQYRCLLAGVARVNISFPYLLIICAYPVHSFALDGYPTKFLASPATPTAVYSPSFPFSLPTSPYFSSCSLGCLVCAVTEATRLVWSNSSGDRYGFRQSLSMKCVDRLRKGVIWLLIATVAEVPPVVTLTSFSFVCLSLISILRHRYSWF